MQIYRQTRNDEPHSLKASTAALLQEGRSMFSWRRKGQKGLYGHSRAGIAGQQSSPTVSCASPSSPSVASRRPNLNCYTSLLGSAHSRSGRGGRAGGGKEEEEEYTRGGKEGVQRVVCILARSPSLPSFLPLFLARRKVLGTLGKGHVPSCPRRGPGPSCASCRRRLLRPLHHSRQRPPVSSALAPDRNH